MYKGLYFVYMSGLNLPIQCAGHSFRILDIGLYYFSIVLNS